jgi:hypothetical protein
MKKLITIVSAFLLPAVSFAQDYSFRMMNCQNGGYGCNGFDSANPILSIFLILLIPLIWIIFVVSVFVFWLLMLIDAIKNSPEKTRLIWVIVIVFTHIIGALIYYFMERRPKDKAKIHRTEKKEETK